MRYKKDLYEKETSVLIIGSSVKIEDLKNSGRKERHETLHLARKSK